MKSKSLPEEVIGNLLLFFKELPVGYRVLWKWELDEKIPGQPENILTQTWMPQESILAHPKVRVFITQGGLQSFQEAVHYGVPTVGIPWFGDQECIVSKMVDAGVGARLLASDLYLYEKVKTTLEMVLYNESFSKNMKRLSTISQDFTSRALDKTVFWIEHVARHGGAPHLRPTTADSTLFEYFCLDIIAVILVIVSIVSIVVFCVVKLLIFVIFRRSSVEKIKGS
ncbi:unnamed protein product [Bemisia tabaci]|uniref:UDP-glucuronosyltransferase n=1 Tax=Bemisia tabaci TaxID=7038 RepID=A0A9P0APP5_BEMTA|nr:unnamed protein product [Bemisia tabaci]